MRRQEFPAKATPKRRGGGWLPIAVAALVVAVLADASAQKVNVNVAPRISAPPTVRVGPPTTINSPKININTSPNINVTPRVNINTVNVPVGPRVGQPTGYGTPVGVRVNPRYVAPQSADYDPPPRRGRKKTVETKKIVEKKQLAGGSPPRGQKKGVASRGIAGLPPVGERRLVFNEVVLEISGNPSQQTIEALARRHRLTHLESQRLTLTNTTWFRWQIPDGRPVRAVVRALMLDGIPSYAGPNYAFKAGQHAEPTREPVSPAGDQVQYMIGKLRLPQAHGIAKGEKVLIAVIDSGIDDTHPELAGVVLAAFDSLETGEKPHTHGTAIAGAIAAQARLVGVAPRSQILAARAFGATSDGAESTTFKILKSLDWAVAQGARVINMSFAGPSDAAMQKALAAAHGRGVVLIAAAGNAGPKSAPLFPAADPNVIAVTATDADDKLFPESNRGRHIAVAAPGVKIFVPKPGGGYDFTSGTSFAAAHVSGVAALILERKPDLSPDDVRKILVTTAKDLGPKGRDDQFGAGLTDAFQAISILEPGKFQASGAAAR